MSSEAHCEVPLPGLPPLAEGSRGADTTVASAATGTAPREAPRESDHAAEQISRLQREIGELRRAFAELELVQSLQRSISERRDTAGVLGQLLGACGQIVELCGGAVFLTVEGSGELTIGAEDRLTESQRRSIMLMAEDGILDWGIRAGRCTIVPDIAGEGQGSRVNFVIGPMVAGSERYGACVLATERSADAFVRQELDLIEVLCGQAAVALANARLILRLEKERNKSAAILQSVGVGLFTVDRDCVTTSANSAAEDILGFSAEEMVGGHCRTFFDRPFCGTSCILREDTPDRADLEATLAHKGGRAIPTIMTAVKLRDPDGRIVGAVETFKDITDLKQMTDRLRHLSAYNRNILESMTAGVLVVDLDFVITTINREGERTLELEPGSLENTPIYDIPALKEVSRELAHMLATAHSRSREELVRQEVTVLSGKGRRIPLGLSTALLRDEDGEITGCLGIFRDLTEIKKLEEQTRRAKWLASLGEMATGVAHEIRNPLSSIAGFVDLLTEELAEGDPARSYTEIMQSEIERLNNLVSSVMAFARPPQPELKMGDLNALLRRLAVQLERDVAARHARLELSLSPTLPAFAFDSGQITQALINLIRNALRAVEPGGAVRLVTALEFAEQEVAAPPVWASDHGAPKARANRVAIHVEDSGRGIPEAIRDKIFDPFFTTDRQGGTGLGLAITNRIISEHGGVINLVSEVGVGTRFTILLPLRLRSEPGESA